MDPSIALLLNWYSSISFFANNQKMKQNSFLENMPIDINHKLRL